VEKKGAFFFVKICHKVAFPPPPEILFFETADIGEAFPEGTQINADGWRCFLMKHKGSFVPLCLGG